MKEKVLKEFCDLYYAYGLGEYPPSGMLSFLTKRLDQPHNMAHWITCLLPKSKVYDMKVIRLTKSGRRVGLYIEVKAKISKDLCPKRIKHAQKFNNIIIKKTMAKVCVSYYLTNTGTEKGSYGVNRSFNDGKWSISSNDKVLEKIHSPIKLKEEKKKELESIIGNKALKALESGGTLNIWRNSTPHNWWVEKNGKTIWHSDEYSRVRPPLKFFSKKNDSREVVSYGASWFRGADDGKPQHSIYKLNI